MTLDQWIKQFARRKWPLIVVLFVLLFCVFYFSMKQSLEKQKAQDIDYQLDRYELLLESEVRSLKQAFNYWQTIFSTRPHFEVSEFELFAQQILNSYQSVLAMSWAPRVNHLQRAAFEENIRQPIWSVPFYDNANNKKHLSIENVDEIFANKQEIQGASEQDFYFPVVDSYPYQRVQNYAGLDVLSLFPAKYQPEIVSLINKGEVFGLPSGLFSGDDGKQVVSFILAMPVRSKNKGGLVSDLVFVTLPSSYLIENSGFKSLSDVSEAIRIEDISENYLALGFSDFYRWKKNVQNDDDVFKTDRVMRTINFFNYELLLSVYVPRVTAADWLNQFKKLFLYLAIALILGLLFLLMYLRKQRTQTEYLGRKRAQQLEIDNARLAQDNARLLAASKVDSLTGLPNRKAFDHMLHQEWERAKRFSLPLGLLIVEIDHFDKYREAYGKELGNQCLKLIAHSLQSVCTRSGDFIAMYSSHQFAVILPNSGPDAMRVAERCRAAVSSKCIEHSQSLDHDRVTVSIGMSSAIVLPDAKLVELTLNAHTALNSAQNRGRNRVIFKGEFATAKDLESKTSLQEAEESAQSDDSLLH